MRRHRGGGDAARMRARGIEPAGVARGWFQFILWVLPTRSSLSNPVGQSVCCVLSLPLSLSFSSLATASFPLSFLYSHPSAIPARPALIRITHLSLALSLSLCLSTFSLTLSLSVPLFSLFFAAPLPIPPLSLSLCLSPSIATYMYII